MEHLKPFNELKSLSYPGIDYQAAAGFLNQDEITVGMVGIDDDDVKSTIVKIYTPDQLRDPNVWNEVSEWDENGTYTCENSYEETLKRFDDVDPKAFWVSIEGNFENKMMTKTYEFNRTVLQYGSTIDGTYVYWVPDTEGWKKHAKDNLKDTNSKTGILEKTVILEGKSWFTDEEVMKPQDVCEGMVGFDIYNGIQVTVLESHRVGDLDNESFKQLQKKSESKWLSYEYELIEPERQPAQYVPDKDKKITNVDQFLNVNSFASNLQLDDYLMVVKTNMDISGRGYNVPIAEVLPYNADWLEVPMAEYWKKSRKIQTVNKQIGIMERRREKLEMQIEFDKTKFVSPEDLTPGMIGYPFANMLDDKYKIVVVGAYKIDEMDEKTFQALQQASMNSSGWLTYFYERDSGNKWWPVTTVSDSYKNLDDFLDRNPFKILKRDSYLVLGESDWDFTGTWLGSSKKHYEVFPYGTYDVLVPISEYWKTGKKINDANDKTGIFE